VTIFIRRSVRSGRESFQTTWATAIADALNERWLPPGYFAEEQVPPSVRVEIDVATFEESAGPESGSAAEGTALALARTNVWSPPAPAASVPLVYPPQFEVLVFREEGGPKLVGAIELVSPGNKDRSTARRAFIAKCASYLAEGIGVVIVDVVTTRSANLHNEIIAFLQGPEEAELPSGRQIYAAGYRPLQEGEQQRADVWTELLSIGAKLPVMPLALDADTVLPIDLEQTYEDACQRRRLA
jgi:Protein of unknown function (DUF4058)